MKLLIDTSIFLEVILNQQRAEEAKALLSEITAHDMFMTDFSLHSIGILLFRHRQHEIFQKFCSDMIRNSGVKVLSVPVEDMGKIANSARNFHLDFDDAYQYVTAESHNLTIVSFDADFNRTKRGYKTPMEVLEDG